jgi:hypothetical protein
MIEALESVIEEPKAVGAYTEAELLAGLEAFKLARGSWGSFWLLYEKPASFRDSYVTGGAYVEGWWTLFKSICKRTGHKDHWPPTADPDLREPIELDDYLIGKHTDNYDPNEVLRASEWHKLSLAFERAVEAKGKATALVKGLKGSIDRNNKKAKEGAAK